MLPECEQVFALFIRCFPHCEAIFALLFCPQNRRCEGWEKQGVEAEEYVSPPLTSPHTPGFYPRIGIEQAATETG